MKTRMHTNPFDRIEAELVEQGCNGPKPHEMPLLRIAEALALSASLLVLFALLLMPGTAEASDLGTVGPTYPIAEQDLLDHIQARLRALEQSGELARVQAANVARAQRSAETPVPVSGLRKATVSRVWRFDPSVRFDEPVVDAKGRIVVPAGMLANPLAVVRMPADWMLFDGRDPAQVVLARRQLDEAAATGRPIKPILVAGSPLALSQQWKRPVYFDQYGRISRRLGLTAVPARVSQDGLSLLIQELVP